MSPGDEPLPRWLHHAAWFSVIGAALFTGVMVWRACVNVPLWDDFDGFLGFLLEADAAPSWWTRFQLAAAFHNEHRTLTCRAPVWFVHALGGGMDFRVLGLVSAAMLPLTAVLLIAPVRDRGERALAALVVGAFLFNLQHWENLFWGGSGCGHLVVLLPSIAALLCIRREGLAALACAAVCAALAIYSLAQGFAVLVAGAGVLIVSRRWRDTLLWLGASVAITVPWLIGRPGSEGFTLELLAVARFGLGSLGAPLAFGVHAASPWVGACVVAAIAVCVWRGEWKRRPFHASVVGFALIALAMIAAGRTGMDADGYMVSRYRVLAALAIAPTVWMFMTSPDFQRHGRGLLAAACTLVVAYAVNEALSNAWRAQDYRDRMLSSAAHYAATGTLEGAPTALYYDLPKAEQILEASRASGIYDLRTVVTPEEKR